MIKIPDLTKSRNLLGLDTIISALANRANSPGAKDIISTLAPVDTLDEAMALLDETVAMLDVLRRRPDFDIEPCENTHLLLAKARKVNALAGPEIKMFAPLLRTAERLRIIYAAEGIDEGHPLWAQIPAIHGLADLIDESLDDDGHVRPTATPEIERLYKSVNSLRQSIRSKAEALLKDKNISPMLQDEYVTLRENRFVLPIRAEHKSHVEGIIHDSSNSGMTFFIEPRELVELNNRLRTVEMELADEIAKLLADLTTMIVEEEEGLARIYDVVLRLDVIYARARLAKETNAIRPLFGERLELKDAANPLMLLEGKWTVRNDISMPEGTRALIISGPNTGGKTVALKTVGLLALMARMGMFITSGNNSKIPFYCDVFADIGDSQSISDDLSTFSAHLVTMNEIIRRARRGSLVLLDELMVSTDPREGSALAGAALDKLVAVGADVIITTHFHELKILAQSQPEFFNASMEFDKLQGRPTYRMVAGIPGSSSALAVAEKLGLDREIITAARARLEGGDERIEKALDDLRDQKIRMENALRDAERAHAEAERALKDAEKIRADVAEQRDELAKTAKRKLAADIAEARRQINAIVEEAREKSKDRPALKAVRARFDEIAEKVREAGAPEERVTREDLKSGDEVYITALEKRGVLVSTPEGGRAEVALGPMRLSIDIKDVIGLKKGKGKTVVTTADTAPVSSTGDEPANEIDIRGMRAEAAVETLERRLDDMLKTHVNTLRVIHGKGGGALRAATREYLAGSPYVADFRPGDDRQGGDGVTLVTLKN